jgi:hypothetical protein
MKVHVIYAHPVDGSFNAAIHRTVVETLIRSGPVTAPALPTPASCRD